MLGLSRLTENSVNRFENAFGSVRFMFSGLRFSFLLSFIEYYFVGYTRFDWLLISINSTLTNEKYTLHR
jgi:hypothetical protein